MLRFRGGSRTSLASGCVREGRLARFLFAMGFQPFIFSPEGRGVLGQRQLLPQHEDADRRLRGTLELQRAPDDLEAPVHGDLPDVLNDLDLVDQPVRSGGPLPFRYQDLYALLKPPFGFVPVDAAGGVAYDTTDSDSSPDQ